MMKHVLLSVFVTVQASFAWADARHTALAEVLKLAELSEILHQEGQDYAQALQEDFLEGRGGAGWQAHVDRIYSPEKLTAGMRQGLEAALTGEALEETIRFFGSDLGVRIITLENSARVAMAQDDIEAAAREAYASASGLRAVLIDDMIAAGDLINRNVTSALNSNVQFLRGMVDGDMYEMSEDDILREVVGDKEEIELDTASWLGAFMYMAYSPLSDAELGSYVAFSQSPAGIALNTGFFAGFDPLYEDISYALGRAIALNFTAEEL